MSDISGLIEKLNPKCRQILERAAEVCVTQTHFNVELEHLVLQIFEKTETDLYPILRNFEVDPSTVTAAITRTIDGFKRGNSRTPALSPHIIKAMQDAYMISSLRLQETVIRTGSLLLAILEDDALRGMMIEAAPELAKIDREVLGENLAAFLDNSKETDVPGSGLPEPGRRDAANTTNAVGTAPTTSLSKSGRASALDAYTIDLTAQARAGTIDPIIGRDSEIRQVIDILMRRRQNNPILTGSPGVGKTAVVEGLAQKVAAGEVPTALENIAIHILDLGLLQAGAGVKGEFENRLKGIISEVTASTQPIILFIDEAHTLIGAGGAAGQGDAANLLKPALARGELRTIAATTWSEYKKYFEKDPALTRRFQVIAVDEPDEATAVQMLRALVPNLEAHHQVRVLNDALVSAVSLSHRYITSRQLPDKAISVIDTACARVAAAQTEVPAELQSAIDHLRMIDSEKLILKREANAGIDHTSRVEDLENEQARVENQKGLIEARWKSERETVQKIVELERTAEKSTHMEGQVEIDVLKLGLENIQDGTAMIPLNVDASVVAEVVSGWTGIPVGRIRADEIETVVNLRSLIEKRIVGQPFALETIQKRISVYRANLGEPSKPTAVFLLVGPSGVGKTETALTLAELLYGGERNVISINMSEYQEAHSVAGLKGAPPGYVGYGSGGILTEAVRRNPYSVVLLDEVEKAHPDVLEIFYQVFDKGVLEDSEGTAVNFKNTIILLTTNLASETILSCTKGQDMPSDIESIVELIRPELVRYFKPALLGRMTIVPYLALNDAQIRDIVELKLEHICQQFRDNHGAELTYDSKILDLIAARCQEVDTGARAIDAIINQNFLPKLAESLLSLMASGDKFSAANVGLDQNNDFTLSFSDDLKILQVKEASSAVDTGLSDG
jgi:type VI secretion system protein VasG